MNVRLFGAMADLGIQRRRKEWPKESGMREVESAKTWFLTPGETGHCIYHLVEYIRLPQPRPRRSRKPSDVRSESRKAVLAHIQAWLEEPPTDYATRLGVIRNAANTCGKYGFIPMHNGLRMEDPSLRRLPPSLRHLTGFFDELDTRKWVPDVKTFFRDLGPLLVDAEKRLSGFYSTLVLQNDARDEQRALF